MSVLRVDRGNWLARYSDRENRNRDQQGQHREPRLFREEVWNWEVARCGKKCSPLQTDNQSSILGTQWCTSVIPALLGRDKGSGDKRVGQTPADQLVSLEKAAQDTKQWRHAGQRMQPSKTCLLACTGSFSLSFLSFKQIIKEIKEKKQYL